MKTFKWHSFRHIHPQYPALFWGDSLGDRKALYVVQTFELGKPNSPKKGEDYVVGS